MTNPTSNFNWQMPTPTDLVTDLPADFEVFGQAVDTSMADLLGGTTGQILAKASNSNMDFTWVTNDVGDITAVNVTAPITGGGSSGAVTIGVSAASTAAAGVVQLSDSTSTTSSVLASTPTATKSAYDLAAAAVPKSTVTTAGDVIYATGSAAVTRLGIGTAGQVLTVNSGATAPEWAAATSGGWTLASTTTLSSTSTSIAIPSGYKEIRIFVENFQITPTAGYPAFQFNSVTTSTYRTLTTYVYNASTSGMAGGTTTFFQIGAGGANGTGNNKNMLVIDLPDYENTTSFKMVRNMSIGQETGGTDVLANNTHAWLNTAAISTIQFVVNTGWAAGTVYIYGVK
jgi:hypothetical protein